MNLKHKLTAILVDDEPSAINNLSILLQKHCPTITIVGTADCVDNAVLEIQKHKPDVVFLDIEMPEKSGFELFDETTEQFQTIFVTAYDEYALKAFEVSALDYLLKPIEIDRLKKAVLKLSSVAISKEKNVSALRENIKQSEITQLLVRDKDKKMLINVEDIICFEANNSYCIIYTELDNKLANYVYSKSLRYFYELLNENPFFFRPHRSWFVNLKKIKTFSLKNATITLKYDVEALLSKNKMKEFATRVGG